MSEVHFTNLLIVVAIALAAPLALGFFPRIRLPAIVLSNGGQSLLGQSFLSKFASVKIEGDKMVLR